MQVLKILLLVSGTVQNSQSPEGNILRRAVLCCVLQN